MSKLHREFVALRLQDFVPSYAARYLVPAFAGDVEAAQFLAFSLNNSQRGNVAVAMWNAKVSRPAFRAFFAFVWGHDHAYLIDAAETRRRLSAMFRYADFPRPDLPETVQVWRGAYDVTAADAALGYS
jgi:hypothetical protein